MFGEFAVFPQISTERYEVIGKGRQRLLHLLKDNMNTQNSKL